MSIAPSVPDLGDAAVRRGGGGLVTPLRPAPAGFALYVGLDDPASDVPRLVAELQAHLARIAPGVESYASVVVAAPGAGRGIDVVRSALAPPSSPAPVRRLTPVRAAPTRPRGLVIDLTRRRVAVNGAVAPLTSGECALLRLLVAHEGETVARGQIVSALAAARRGAPPNERTVDVHVRRLRVKLEPYEDVVRTVRGEGYQFDRQADVAVRLAG